MFRPALKEHNEICVINYRNNFLTSKTIFIFYYVSFYMIDHYLFLAIYSDNLEIKLTMIINAILVSCQIFISSSLSAYLSSLAHSPYNTLHSIVVRRTFKLEDKFIILNLLERLGGSVIANYCLDWFAITNFEVYLLIGNVFKNFLQFLDIVKKY